MSGRHRGFLEFLGELTEQFSHFNVVARNQQESDQNDLPIIEVVVDESDHGISIVRSTPPDNKDVALNLGAFYQDLKNEIEQYPDYSLMVTERFQIDEEHKGRLDMPLDSVEVDEDAEVLRLLF
jgi:hypothetical protein